MRDVMSCRHNYACAMCVRGLFSKHTKTCFLCSQHFTQKQYSLVFTWRDYVQTVRAIVLYILWMSSTHIVYDQTYVRRVNARYSSDFYKAISDFICLCQLLKARQLKKHLRSQGLSVRGIREGLRACRLERYVKASGPAG